MVFDIVFLKLKKGYMSTCMLLHITSSQCMKLVLMHNNLDMQT
jgi:hypothetical protein